MSGRGVVWDARLSEPGSPVCTPDWLALREPADAAARSAELAGLAGPYHAVISDLGCGSGSMLRWLPGLLPGPQRWILHDRDPELLARAVAETPGVAADGAPVLARAHLGDLTDLAPPDLAGSTLVTASALLDILTRDQVERIAAACTATGAAALLTLTVSGRVRIAPEEPLDAEFAAAFDAHQRRDGMLGPDAGPVAGQAFRARGASVQTRPSPWRLTAGGLAEEWLRGWIGAACMQEPTLARHAAAYLSRRLTTPDLQVEVGHTDLLALPVVGS